MDYFASITKMPEGESVGGVFVKADSKSEVKKVLADILLREINHEAALLVFPVPLDDKCLPEHLFGRLLSVEELSLLFGAVRDIVVVISKDGAEANILPEVSYNAQN